MRLAEAHYDNRETGCCARLDEVQWNEREFVWKERPFVKDHIHAFLHVPLDFGSVMAREHRAVEEAAAYPELPFWLVEELSPWGSDVYLATDRDVPGATMVHLSGTFMTKVFEGPYRQIGAWMAEMESYVRRRGHHLQRLYFYYAQCPRCAKRLGKNQVVLFAKVS